LNKVAVLETVEETFGAEVEVEVDAHNDKRLSETIEQRERSAPRAHPD
jgi:hypothetical protein